MSTSPEQASFLSELTPSPSPRSPYGAWLDPVISTSPSAGGGRSSRGKTPASQSASPHPEYLSDSDGNEYKAAASIPTTLRSTNVRAITPASDLGSQRMQRSAWAAELRRLRVREASLVSEIARSCATMGHTLPVKSPRPDTADGYASTLSRELLAVRDAVRSFSRTRVPLSGPPRRELVQRLFLSAESQISDFCRSRFADFESLREEEERLEREIDGFAARMDKWGRDSGPTQQQQHQPDSSRSRGDIAVAGVRSKLDARLADSDLPPEVIAYEKFLETSGGVRGGWRQEDHETFLKVARQVGLVEGVAATAWSGEVKEPGEPRINRAKIPTLMSRLLPLVPGMDEESLSQHISWHLEHERLRRGRKEAIRRWKKGGKNTTNANQNANTSDGSTDHHGHGHGQGHGHGSQNAAPNQATGDRAASKARLAAWQEARRKAREEEEKQRAEAEAEERRKAMARARENKARRAERRARAEARHKSMGRQQEYLASKLSATTSTRAPNPEALRALRARDAAHVGRRVGLVKSRRLVDEERQRRITELVQKAKSASNKAAESDPDRLLQPTRATVAREEAAIEEAATVARPVSAGPQGAMGRRAVPTWRKPASRR